jgi:hypothetical protein
LVQLFQLALLDHQEFLELLVLLEYLVVLLFLEYLELLVFHVVPLDQLNPYFPVLP